MPPSWTVLVPARGARLGLGFVVEPEGVRFFTCLADCKKTESQGILLSLPAAVRSGTPRLVAHKFPQAGELAHLQWESSDSRRYNLILRLPARTEVELEPRLLLRGFSGGPQDSEIEVLREGGEELLVVFERRPAVLCGQEARGPARRYDPKKGEFVPARLPPWSSEARKKAGAETARRVPPVVGSEMQGEPAGLVIGLQASFLSEEKLGRWFDRDEESQVESAWGSVALEIPEGARALVVSTAGEAGSGSGTLWVQEGSSLRKVSFERGGRQEISLSAETRCVVLGSDAAPLGVREVAVRVDDAGDPSTRALIYSLGTETRGALARAALLLRGEEAGRLLAEEWPKLSERARGEALDVASGLPRDAGAPALLEAFLEGSVEERKRAEAELLLRREFVSSVFGEAAPRVAPGAEARFARLFLQIDAPAALPWFGERLEQKSPARRRALREVLSDFSRTEEGRALASELETQKWPRKSQIELLRALSTSAERRLLSEESSFLELWSKASFRESYLLLEPGVRLRERSPRVREGLEERASRAASSALGWSAREQEAWLLRYLELLSEPVGEGGEQEGQARLLELSLAHPNRRVRQMAARVQAVDPTAKDTSALLRLSRKDAWPEVRQEALIALGRRAASFEKSKEGEEAMIDALAEDESPLVRRAAARALRELDSEESLERLRRSLMKDEDSRVRAESALSLGKRCDVDSLERLTELGQNLLSAGSEGEVEIGLAAWSAVGQLAPADLEERLAPVRAPSVPGPLRAQIERAVGRVGASSCR